MERQARLPRNNTSGYVGVGLTPYGWRAKVHDEDSRRHHVGYYDTREEAARAYDEEVRKRFGDRARVNFPRGQE